MERTGRRMGIRVGLRWCFTLVVIVSVFAVVAAAAAAPNSSSSFLFETNGAVNGVVEAGGTAYLGGVFSYVGPHTGGLVSLSRSSGSITQRFPTPDDGQVRDITSDGAGGWYVGGLFSSIGGVPRTNLANVLADGSVDAAWTPPAPNGEIAAIALAGGRVYIGGTFSRLGSSFDSGIAALDPVTGDRIAMASFSNGFAISFFVEGNTLWVAGFFQFSGRSNLMALDATTGGVLPFSVPVNSVVSTVVKDGNSLWVGGHSRPWVASRDSTSPRLMSLPLRSHRGIMVSREAFPGSPSARRRSMRPVAGFSLLRSTE